VVMVVIRQKVRINLLIQDFSFREINRFRNDRFPQTQYLPDYFLA